MRGRRARPVRRMLGVGAAVFVMGCGASPNPGATQSTGATAVDPIQDATGRLAGQDADGGVQSLRLDDMATERTHPTSERRNPFRSGSVRQEPDRRLRCHPLLPFHRRRFAVTCCLVTIDPLLPHQVVWLRRLPLFR